MKIGLGVILAEQCAHDLELQEHVFSLLLVGPFIEICLDDVFWLLLNFCEDTVKDLLSIHPYKRRVNTSDNFLRAQEFIQISGNGRSIAADSFNLDGSVFCARDLSEVGVSIGT